MKNKLLQYRKKIDDIDKKVVSLLNERAKAAVEIGKIKNVSSKAVYAPGRETEVLNNVIDTNKGPLLQHDFISIYKEIMSSCRALEEKPKVAYLGPAATFTHQAAIRQFGSKTDFVPALTIPEVIYEAEKSRVDFAVIPVENSNEGAVNIALDLLVDTTLSVINEINMKISHCLLSKTKLEKIKVLYSHQQAIAQCGDWIRKNLPSVEIFPISSTSQSAKLASQNLKSAAISSQTAAEIYNLNILAKSIEDNRDNWTRFFVLGNTKAAKTGKDKTTIIFSIKDKVSVLHDILAIFSKNKINLTKIESRPTKKKAWQYIFFVDFIGHIDDYKIAKTVEEVKNYCVFLKVLGSYPVAG